MTPDRPLLGILLMLGFCITVPFADALAKVLGAQIGVGQLVAIRLILQVLLLLPLVWWLGLSLKATRRHSFLAFIRAVLQIVGTAAMILALRYLPLADAVAIAFVMPFIILLLGHLILGEEVGKRRIIACGVGFIGTLMVIQPNFAEVGWLAALPLIVAVDFALFILLTRQLARQTDPIVLQANTGIIACAILLPVLLVFSPFDIPDLGLVLPQGITWILLFAMGALGTLAHLFMTWSLRFAPAATLAPMQYLEIPVAALVGWLIFREFPNGMALAGILVTVGAGLYIIHREQRISRLLPATPEAETGQV